MNPIKSLVLFALFLLAACGGGGGGSSSNNSPSAAAINDGTGPAAKFSNPAFIVRDANNLYLTEQLNNTIRKIVITTGQVTTLAGKAGESGSVNGKGNAARFHTPNGITSDGTNLYVVDSGNHTIRKIVIASGEVTTLAGTAGESGDDDGIGASASFFFPTGVTTVGGNLYVTSGPAIRKINLATAEVSTFAGGCSGTNDGIGASACFINPSGITTDGVNLYVADRFSNTVRKVVIATAEVTTFVGTAYTSGSTDSTGADARFSTPEDLTIAGTYLYLTDTTNKLIRKIDLTTANVTTFAGTLYEIGSANGIGAAARFNVPFGITTDGINLYVTDIFNRTIRKIVIATAEVTTLAGTAGVDGIVGNMGATGISHYPTGVIAEESR